MLNVLLISGSLLALSSALPIANYWVNPLGSLPTLNQYHAQDGSGSYRYGYTGPHHAKMETRSNGVTQGGYSYIDANGILQTVAYSADAENGFRVRASNLPQQPTAESLLPVSETPEVAVARRRHLEEFEEIENNINRDASSDKTSWQVVEGQVQGQNIPNSVSEDYKHSQYERDTSEKKSNDYQGASNLKNPFLLTGAEALRIEIPKPDPSLLKAERNREGNVQSYQQYQNLGPNAIFQQPLPNVRRTIVAPATSFVLPVVPYSRLHSSLHHTQDSLGQYDYSYVGDTSSKTESRSLDGTTRGAYSYVDANGLLQQVHYIADHNGFRVIATNLPEA